MIIIGCQALSLLHQGSIDLGDSQPALKTARVKRSDVVERPSDNREKEQKEKKTSWRKERRVYFCVVGDTSSQRSDLQFGGKKKRRTEAGKDINLLMR